MSTVKATYSGFVGYKGQPVVMHEGDVWDVEHPLVQARPELFTEPVPEPKRPTIRGRGKDGDG